MTAPAVSWIAFFAQALPVLAAAAVRDRNDSVPYRRLALWCALLLLADVAALWMAHYRGFNLDIPYVALPLEVGVCIWIMAAWQPTEPLRRAYSISIPVIFALTAVAILVTDPSVSFVRWVSPLLALTALVAVLHTLVGRTLLSRSQLTSHGWFWVCMGIGIFWTGFITVPMFANMFLETHLQWVVTAYMARGWVNVGAFLLITWGVLCPVIRPR